MSHGEGLGSLIEHPDVAFELEISGTSASWGVRDVRMEEGLNRLSTCTVHARCDAHPTVRDLLYCDVRLTMERGTQRRHFKGLVQHARVRDHFDGVEVELRIVPAFWLLTQKIDSRIYQQMTVVQIVEDLFARTLSNTRRAVRNDTTATYPVREHTTQYQESCFAFLARLTEDEGIFWYFDHESDENETLVLADGTAGLPRVRESEGGRAPFRADPALAPDHEAVSEIVHLEEIGATDVVVSEHDWTRPSLSLQGVQTGRSSHEPRLEVYDHSDAVLLHGYDGERYTGDNASMQARLRAECLDLGRHSWSMCSTVVTAQPGYLLELVGAPEADLDGRYLITRVTTFGSATEGNRGSLENTIDAVPTSFPYRPARRTRRPVISGPETAIVVGPAGEEIHTDEHGRVRVHFHWDRVNERTAEASSCWIRVAHDWAGAGFGTFFLPRIGMEVVVSFLGGNADRPLVTGCVYNGENRAHVELDAKKTQSVIRTKSSPDSEGYNEIRFEDEAGHEFVSIHAQRNLLERVLSDHRTHVGHDQTNVVDQCQQETIGVDQTLRVVGNRFHLVEANERHTVRGNRALEIDHEDDQTVHGSRSTTIDTNESLDVLGDRSVHVIGAQTLTMLG